MIQFIGKTYFKNLIKFFLIKLNKLFIFLINEFNFLKEKIKENKSKNQNQKSKSENEQNEENENLKEKKISKYSNKNINKNNLSLNESESENEILPLPLYTNEIQIKSNGFKKNIFNILFKLKLKLKLPLIGENSFLYRLFNFMNSDNNFLDQGIFHRKSIHNLKTKLKTIYFYIFPMGIIIYKFFLSGIFIKIFEFFLFKNTEREPFINIIYHKLINIDNEIKMSLNVFDYLILFICILPNTIMILYFHIKDQSFNFILDNICLLNFLPIIFASQIELIIIGILNFLLIITRYSFDYETYQHFNLWFNFFGFEFTY